MPLGRKNEPPPLPETLFNIDSMLHANGDAIRKLAVLPKTWDRTKQMQRLRDRQNELLERRLKLTDRAECRQMESREHMEGT